MIIALIIAWLIIGYLSTKLLLNGGEASRLRVLLGILLGGVTFLLLIPENEFLKKRIKL